MEEFELKGHDNFIKIGLRQVYNFPEQTCHWGGYDAEAKINIKVDDFSVNSSFYISTGEIFDFFENLSKCNDSLSGFVYFRNYEENLIVNLHYDVNGQIKIDGSFYKLNGFSDCSIKFEFNSDQSYIQSTLKQLRQIVAKYGGMNGVKN